MKKKRLQLLQLSLLVLIVGAVGALVWWSDAHDSGLLDPRPVVELKSPDCNPRGVLCLTRDKGYSVSLEVDTNATYLSPFGIRVRLFGFSTERVTDVSVRFTMPEMYMGENRSTLNLFTPQGAEEWAGTSILPVCISGRQDWIATVIVSGEQRVFKTQFAFVIDPA